MSRQKGPIVTAERLRQLLHYDPDTGRFVWKQRPCNKIHVGDPACNLRTDGYQSIQIDNRLYKAHRLAWLYMTGRWPTRTVDHRNRDPGDNRWLNLREATRSQQVINQRVRGRVPFKGVTFVSSRARPFRAIFHEGAIRKHLGYFATAEDAAAAYRVEAIRRHGDFAVLERTD